MFLRAEPSTLACVVDVETYFLLACVVSKLQVLMLFQDDTSVERLYYNCVLVALRIRVAIVAGFL